MAFERDSGLTFSATSKLDGNLLIHVLPQIQNIFFLGLLSLPSGMATTSFAGLAASPTSSPAMVASSTSSTTASLMRL